MVSKNIICPVCGASCDDIRVDYNGENINVKNACKMGNAKFHELVSTTGSKSLRLKKTEHSGKQNGMRRWTGLPKYW